MKTKLLITTSSFPRNQSDFKGFIYLLADKLKQYHDVFILAPQSENSLAYEEIEGLKIYRHAVTPFGDFGIAYDSGILPNIKKNPFLILVVPFLILSQTWAIRNIVRKENITAINAHWIIPQGFSAVLYKVFFNKKIKILVSALGSDINFFDNFVGNVLKKFILNRCNEITVMSNYFRDKVKSLGYPREVYVYPLGVDTNNFHPSKYKQSLKEQFAIKGEMILFVGWIIELKGIRYLIHAMKAIIENHPETKLVVVGQGTLMDEMKQKSRELGIEKNVVFAGRVSDSDLPSYFATSDIFILPSFSEGFPVTVQEALSSETIAVVSDIPVFTDWAKEVDFVHIVRCGNSEDIAKKINEIILRESELADSKRRAREYTVQNFDWEIIAKKFSDLILKMERV